MRDRRDSTFDVRGLMCQARTSDLESSPVPPVSFDYPAPCHDLERVTVQAHRLVEALREGEEPWRKDRDPSFAMSEHKETQL